MRHARAAITLVVLILTIPALAFGADGRGPEGQADQGIQGDDELEAATKAVRALFAKADVDQDGKRDIEMVATVYGNDYWVIGDLDLSTKCSPTLFDESSFTGCDALKFERVAGEGGAETYVVTLIGEGGNPLGPQGPQAQKAIHTIPQEFAAASRTVGSGGAVGCTLAGDPECRPLQISGVTYPHAYERISALFDSPRAPDLVVLQTNGGPDSPFGGHGHLSVLQSRATLLVSGRGARRSPLDPDAEANLGIKHVDIAATIAKALGVATREGTFLNGSSGDALLTRQDGRALDDLIEPKFNTFLIVLDGLNPSEISSVTTPNLWSMINSNGGTGEPNATTYEGASAAMISETNTNHVGMTTGVLPGEHGVVANSFFNRASGAREPAEQPSLISAQTLFDVFRSQKPWLRTAAVMGKEKLRFLFDCTKLSNGDCGPSSNNPEGIAVNHVAPDYLLGASTDPQAVREDPDHEHDAPAEPASGSGYTTDSFVMDQVINLTRTEDPDFTFVNLGQIDGIKHLFGSHSPEGLAAITNADVQIGRLMDALKQSDKWEHSILIITSDHSFSKLNGTLDAVEAGGVRVSQPVTGHLTGSRVILSERFTHSGIRERVAHGGSASIYLENPNDAALAAQIASEARAARDALGRPIVASAFCRIPSGDCPPIPVSWGLSNPRVGEVLLTADDEHVFQRTRAEAAAVITGHHGGPTAMPIPLIVASGGSYVASKRVSSPVRSIDIAPTVSWIYGLAGSDGNPFPGGTAPSQRLDEAFIKNPFDAQADGDLSEPIAKRALIVIFDANNSADVHCLLAQYQDAEAVSDYCGETSSVFHPSLYPVPTLEWLRERGFLAEYGSMASFPTVTFPNHNVIGSGAHPAHFDVVGNRFYVREQQRTEAPIDPTNPQNPIYFWSETLYGKNFETLHEATHRTFGDWMGPDNNDPTLAGGAFTASVDEPTVKGADFASLEPHRSIPVEPGFPAHWGRADELAEDTTQECAERDDGYFVESGIDHIGQGQARSLFEDPSHPIPRFMMLNFTLVDGSAHAFGPHTKCALSAYRDSAQRLGRVLETMRNAGVLGETLIVLTGDHGQENQRQLAAGGGFGQAFNQALASSGVSYVTADNFLYLKTMDVALSSAINSGSNEITFGVVDDDTGDTVGGALVEVIDPSGAVIAFGTTPPEQGGAKRMTAPIPRLVSAEVNRTQELLFGERTIGDFPTILNSQHQPSSGEVTLSFDAPATGVKVRVSKAGFSDRSISFDTGESFLLIGAGARPPTTFVVALMVLMTIGICFFHNRVVRGPRRLITAAQLSRLSAD